LSNFVLQKLQIKDTVPTEGGGIAWGGYGDKGSFCDLVGKSIVSGPGSNLGGLEGYKL